MPPPGPLAREPHLVGPAGGHHVAAARERLVVDKLADLAQGGMGSVELGVVRDGRLAGRVVAVKRLHEELARDPEIVSMFVDEAWLTAQIRSPHVVKVEAFAEDARGLFLVSELVQGVSLGRLMAEARARGEAFTERTVAFVASQVCAGLAAAHELQDAEGRPLGLVHRDLTPGNVLVGFDGVVKIADFGIAKAERRVSAATRMGVLKGKPSYVSPEQVRGGAIDGRADLFALGIVLFELLAGRRPWRGKDDTDVLIAMMKTEPASLVELRPDVSPTMARLIEACLRKPAVERPRSAAEVQRAIDAWRSEQGFVRDDPAWLSDFARRNASALRDWFEKALAGRMTSGGPSLQQAESELARTRVHMPPSSGDPARPPAVTSDAATTFYQHATPVPGAAAMAAALAAPPGPAPPRPEAAWPTGAEELARMPASTPQRPMDGGAARTAVMAGGQPAMPSSAAPSPRVASAGPRGPVGATEWMPSPPSAARAPSVTPPSGPPSDWAPGATEIWSPDRTPGNDPASGAGRGPAMTASPSAVDPRRPAPPPAGGGVRIALVFAVVFLATVAVVGALLRSGVLHAP